MEELRIRFEEAIRIYQDKDPGMRLVYEDMLAMLLLIKGGKAGFAPTGGGKKK